jgi:hypothetical protein
MFPRSPVFESKMNPMYNTTRGKALRYGHIIEFLIMARLYKILCEVNAMLDL